MDMLVADASSSIWREKEIFDSIVTDRKDIFFIQECYHKLGFPAPPLQLPMASEKEGERSVQTKNWLTRFLLKCEDKNAILSQPLLSLC